MLTRSAAAVESQKNYRREEGLRTALLNSVISPESALAAQGVSRGLNPVTNLENQRRINEQIGPNQVTRLMYAAQKFGDDAERVKLLIKNVDLRNFQDLENGFSALHYAIKSGNIDVVRVLLEEPVPEAFKFRPAEDVLEGMLLNIAIHEVFTDMQGFILEEDNLETATEIALLIIKHSDPNRWENLGGLFLEKLFVEMFEDNFEAYKNNINGIVDKILEIADVIFNTTKITVNDNLINICLRRTIENGYVKLAEFLLNKFLENGQDLNAAFLINDFAPKNPLFCVEQNAIDMLDSLVSTMNLLPQTLGPDNDTIFIHLVKENQISNEDLYECFEIIDNSIQEKLTYEQKVEFINLFNDFGENALGECFALRRKQPRCDDLIRWLIIEKADLDKALESGVN